MRIVAGLVFSTLMFGAWWFFVGEWGVRVSLWSAETSQVQHGGGSQDAVMEQFRNQPESFTESRGGKLIMDWMTPDWRKVGGDGFGAVSGLTFAARVEPKAFLNVGEAPPPDALWPLYRELRSARLMLGFCDEALGEIARECVIRRVENKVEEDGRVLLTARLVISPGYERGPVSKSGGRLQIAGMNFGAILPEEMLRENSPFVRREIMRGALVVCERLRPVAGNCEVASIKFDQLGAQKRRPRVPVTFVTMQPPGGPEIEWRRMVRDEAATLAERW